MSKLQMKENKRLKTREERIDEINNMLIQLASGSFDAQIELSDGKDELDAIVVGINMLREELLHSMVSTEYLSSIYNGIVDMLLILEPDFSIQTTNRIVQETLDFSERSLKGQFFCDLLSPSNQEDYRHLIDILKKENQIRFLETTLKRKDGLEIPASVSASKLFDKNGTMNGYLILMKDISAIKETERQLRAKNQELDTFVYKSSHDLKGPLASIIGITNIAEMEVEDPTAIKYFDLIRTSATRLDRILVNLTELARLRNSASIVKNVNPQEIVDEIIDHYKLDGKIADLIEFRTNIETITCYNSNDKILHSIIQNLIENAIKYRKMSRRCSPYVSVTIRKQDNGIRIIVEDNGQGIRADKVGKIFNMFQRASDQSKGTGLGLYIVKTSVEKLKGTIHIESVEREGSSFIIDLPSLTIGDSIA